MEKVKNVVEYLEESTQCARLIELHQFTCTCSLSMGKQGIIALGRMSSTQSKIDRATRELRPTPFWQAIRLKNVRLAESWFLKAGSSTTYRVTAAANKLVIGGGN